MSRYPPGFGSARDLDHVDGPLSEEDIVDERCPDCTEVSLVRFTWRASGTTVECARGCNYYREEDPIEEDVP